MEDVYNFLEPIHTLMDTVKKDILSKKQNKGTFAHNREIINSLFNILDYQVTLMNQIVVFNKNNKDNLNNKNSLDYLIRINKDILVSMVNKFVLNINSMFKNDKIFGSQKQYLNNSAKNKFVKILNTQYSNNDSISKINFLTNESFTKFNSPIKKNMEKEFNSTITLTHQSSAKKILSFFDQEKNSYKFINSKNHLYNMKHKMHNDVFEKLYHDNSKCDHEEKKRNKISQYQSFSKSMKEFNSDLKKDNTKKKINNSVLTNSSNEKY